MHHVWKMMIITETNIMHMAAGGRWHAIDWKALKGLYNELLTIDM